ncbi:MAG: metallophosphoesterase, partial [Gammaproteobacteria bacterium]
MKLYVVSDLHTEFVDFEPAIGDADVAILAGDIGVGVSTLDWIHTKFPTLPVIYVLGNHEFYRGNLDDVAAFKAGAQKNVHVLERDSVVIDGIRFLGTTLWTDFRLFGLAEREFFMMEASERMPDFRLIGNGQEGFTALDSIAMHDKSVEWLQSQLAEPFDGDTVVVTHHAPSWLSVADRFKEDPLSPAFCSRLESLMEKGEPSLWVHGHTHDAFDYSLYDTRVVCNPR